MTPAWWTFVRYLGTVAMAASIATQQQYPQYHWLAIVIATLGVLGYHAVPTSQQLLPPQSLIDQLRQLGSALERATYPPSQLTTTERPTPREKSGGILPDGTYPIPSRTNMADETP